MVSLRFPLVHNSPEQLISRPSSPQIATYSTWPWHSTCPPPPLRLQARSSGSTWSIKLTDYSRAFRILFAKMAKDLRISFHSFNSPRNISANESPEEDISHKQNNPSRRSFCVLLHWQWKSFSGQVHPPPGHGSCRSRHRRVFPRLSNPNGRHQSYSSSRVNLFPIATRSRSRWSIDISSLFIGCAPIS